MSSRGEERGRIDRRGSTSRQQANEDATVVTRLSAEEEQEVRDMKAMLEVERRRKKEADASEREMNINMGKWKVASIILLYDYACS